MERGAETKICGQKPANHSAVQHDAHGAGSQQDEGSCQKQSAEARLPPRPGLRDAMSQPKAFLNGPGPEGRNPDPAQKAEHNLAAPARSADLVHCFAEETVSLRGSKGAEILQKPRSQVHAGLNEGAQQSGEEQEKRKQGEQEEVRQLGRSSEYIVFPRTLPHLCNQIRQLHSTSPGSPFHLPNLHLEISA